MSSSSSVQSSSNNIHAVNNNQQYCQISHVPRKPSSFGGPVLVWPDKPESINLLSDGLLAVQSQHFTELFLGSYNRPLWLRTLLTPSGGSALYGCRFQSEFFFLHWFPVLFHRFFTILSKSNKSCMRWARFEAVSTPVTRSLTQKTRRAVDWIFVNWKNNNKGIRLVVHMCCFQISLLHCNRR